MEYLIGVAVAALVCLFAFLSGFDRERVFYPTLVIVIAAYYILFAAMGGSSQSLLYESMVASVFLMLAVVGFKKNLWLVAVALVAHGVYDYSHRLLFHNPGVPVWWPEFCLAADVILGAFLAFLLMRRTGFAYKAS